MNLIILKENELDSLTDRKKIKSAIISTSYTRTQNQDLQEYAKSKGLTLSDVFLKALSSSNWSRKPSNGILGLKN